MSSANHSCDPNTVTVFDGPSLSLRALRKIGKDEELFISYIETSNPYRRRQRELLERYHFTCACAKCQKGASGPADDFLRSPSESSQLLGESVRDLELDEEYAVAEDNVGEDPTSRRIAAVQSLAFGRLEESKRMSDQDQVIERLKLGMQLCADTNLWPLHRQPWPSLRQQLFIHLLSTGEHLEALGQGLKTYFYIDPVMLPEAFHPVRVVHKWTLAMLCLFLSGCTDQPGVDELRERYEMDWGVIIFGLLSEVRENVGKSHGSGSTFAKTVSDKFEEFKTDITRGGDERLKGMRGALEDQWKRLRKLANEVSP